MTSCINGRLDYLVINRGVDPARIVMSKGSPVDRTKYVLWIVPTGANPPVVRLIELLVNTLRGASSGRVLFYFPIVNHAS